MSRRDVLGKRGPLRSRRRRRLVERTGGNDRLPTDGWRYLVPATDTLDGVGPWARGIRAGELVVNGGLDRLVGELVDLDPAPGSDADRSQQDHVDIALLAEPTASELVAAAARSADGGRLLIELHPSRRHTIAEVRARLARAGLCVDEVYSISPGRDGWQPTLWLPTSHPGPMRELLRSGSPWPGRGRRRRVARRIALAGTRWVAVVVERPWLLFPTRPWVLLAVTGQPSDRADGANGLRVLRVGGSSTDQPVVTHHDPGDGRPTAVTKLPTEPSEIDDLIVEAANLRRLAEAAPGLSGVARVLESGPVGPASAAASDPGSAAIGRLTQSHVPGVPLAAVLDANNYGAWLRPVAAWSAALGVATAVRTKPLRETVGGWLDELEHTAPDLVVRSRPVIDRLDLDLRVTQHLDFGPWNIHGESGRVGVIDWVTARPDGLPLGDLAHYATHAAALVAGGYDRDGLAAVHRATVDPANPLGRSVADALAVYCQTVDIDPALVPALRLANWIGSVQRRAPTGRDGIYRWLWELELTAIESASQRPGGRTPST